MISDDNIWMARSARRLILMFSHDWTAQSALGESCYSAADDENHDFSEPDMKSSRMIAPRDRGHGCLRCSADNGTPAAARIPRLRRSGLTVAHAELPEGRRQRGS